MSIRIVPLDEAGRLQTAAGEIPPLLLPQPAERYLARSRRLTALADGHPMAAYLAFAARIAAAQHRLVREQPVTLPPRGDYFHHCAEHGLPPLGAAAWPRDPVWRDLLRALCAELAALPGPAGQVARELEQTDDAALESAARALLDGDFAAVGSARAPLLWAALSVYFSQLAAQLQVTAVAEPDDARHLCPVCAMPPVASVVRLGNESGLRYLHCSLCESEWHLVRAKCSNCEATRDIGYWSLEQGDSQQAAVRGESCGDCGSYLKILALDKDLDAEPAADDLATLALDQQLEQRGFARSGVNPLLFPG